MSHVAVELSLWLVRCSFKLIISTYHDEYRVYTLYSLYSSCLMLRWNCQLETHHAPIVYTYQHSMTSLSSISIYHRRFEPQQSRWIWATVMWNGCLMHWNYYLGSNNKLVVELVANELVASWQVFVWLFTCEV